MPFHLTRDRSIKELPADNIERANAAQAVIGRSCAMEMTAAHYLTKRLLTEELNTEELIHAILKLLV